MNKDELKGCELKYDKSITKEVFKEVYDKLEEYGYKCHHEFNEAWGYFSKSHQYLQEIKETYAFNKDSGGNKQIQISDILDSKEKVKFEKGKWYKNIGNTKDYIGKFDRLDGSTWYCNAYIHEDIFHQEEVRLTSEFNEAIECSLEEIQQYFPLGHEDLIKDEFKKDDYIIQLTTTNSIYLSNIFIYVQLRNHRSLYAKKDNTGSTTQSSWVKYDNPKTWRYATPEEIVEYDRLSKPYNVEDFKKSEVVEDFALPEKWVIKRCNKSEPILNEWLHKNKSRYPDYNKLWVINNNYNGYFHNYPTRSGAHSTESITQGFTEITFNQFKQYVLKEVDEQPIESIKPTSGESEVLTIDDLVEGEIYYYNANQNYFIGKFSYLEDDEIVDKYWINEEKEEYNQSDDACLPITIRKATTTEIKYLKVCYEQDKFIPKSDLDKYDDITFKLKESKFEFNNWYKNPSNKWMVFITSGCTGYGFKNNGDWFNSLKGSWHEDIYTYPQATNEEVELALLAYTKKHYPIGTKYNDPGLNEFKDLTITDNSLSNYGTTSVFQGKGYIYYEGKWAEIVKENVFVEEPIKYDLNTTITRAVKENDPGIIFRECGITEVTGLKEGGCIISASNIKDAKCKGSSCANCPFSANTNGKTVKSALAWLNKDKVQEKILDKEEEGNLEVLDEWSDTMPAESNYQCLSFPTYEYFRARVIKNLYRKDISIKGNLPDLIPKGSITWFRNGLLPYVKSKGDTVHPEGNRYSANIPASYFEVIGDIPKPLIQKVDILTEEIKLELVYVPEI